MPSTCPGDCCRVIHLSADLEDIAEQLVTTTGCTTHWDEAEAALTLFWPGRWNARGLECAAFDRKTRQCSDYARRPRLCQLYPASYGCENCSYDPREPDAPGVRYPCISETGVFCHDNQPGPELRAERQR